MNFDLWLILHKEDYNRKVSRNDAYISGVRRVFELKSSVDIKSEEVIGKILSQISLEDVKTAIKRADNIRKSKGESEGTKIGNTRSYSNPDFSIHEFLKLVLEDSGDF